MGPYFAVPLPLEHTSVKPRERRWQAELAITSGQNYANDRRSAQEREPVAIPGPVGYEERVQQLCAGVVPQRLAIQAAHATARPGHDRVRSRRVPLAGGPQARVHIRRALGKHAEFERAADGYQLVRSDAREKRIE